MVKLKSSLRKLYGRTWIDWPLWNICVTNDHGYVPLVGSTSRSFPHSWLITGFVARLTRQEPLVEKELLTLPEHLRSFSHCVVCSSSIYRFWLPLWYLQTVLITVFSIFANYRNKAYIIKASLKNILLWNCQAELNQTDSNNPCVIPRS